MESWIDSFDIKDPTIGDVCVCETTGVIAPCATFLCVTDSFDVSIKRHFLNKQVMIAKEIILVRHKTSSFRCVIVHLYNRFLFASSR
jgi:uncharacterized protein (AIM24 family)